MKIHDYINLLGMTGTDQVTGMTGIVTSVSYDLYGCILIMLHPGIDADGDMQKEMWFDAVRIKIHHNSDRVLPVPEYDHNEKPSFTRYLLGR